VDGADGVAESFDVGADRSFSERDSGGSEVVDERVIPDLRDGIDTAMVRGGK
jgi:hypothetical protein